MSKPLHVAANPLTEIIDAGTVLKCGYVWSADPQVVTTEALVAVAQNALQSGKPVVVHANGKPEYKITVEKINGNQEIAELYRQAESVPEAWRSTMKELSDDLESEIESRRSSEIDRRIERDLIVVKEARALLAAQEQDHE
jgi:hypothetical protein